MPQVAAPPRVRWFALSFAMLAAVVLAPGASAAWVEFADETVSRYVGPSDTDEKDYAWGDVDQDGDIDLVIVRKEPFTSPGKRVNYLFMNENGVLVNRTSQFAVDSDVAGDFGFNTPTNDRDVALADLNGDGWLDIATATTISDGDPKHIGHPRVYINKKCAGACNGSNWLGFRYEASRIPQMASWTGQNGFNPRFCTVVAGDVTGDGYADLWFGDYDSSGAGGSGEPAGADFNDRLLVNAGAGNPGFFFDATLGAQTHFQGTISVPGAGNQHFAVSAFGAAGAIADMNGDGLKDIVKQTSLNSPLYVGVAYNDTGNQGFFDTYEVIALNSPYFVSVGELNNDNKLDAVITDDGDDRYMLNLGNGTDGLPNFQSFVFSFAHDGTGGDSEDDGFGSQSLIADLDNDGWNDVMISDVDVDIGGCTRRMHIYRNLGGDPGDPVNLQEQTEGSNCEQVFGNPASCQVASIPSDKLEGVHNVAAFDINGDGWKDLVVGRCSGTQVYINQPPAGLNFTYPQGLPDMVPPDAAFDVDVQLQPYGGATVTPGTVQMLVSVGGGPFNPIQATPLGGNLYRAALPAADCAEDYRFFFMADIDQGGTFRDPPNAPTTTYEAVAAIGTTVAFFENVEGNVSSWTIASDASLVGGEWEQAVPVPTIAGNGEQAAPGRDAENLPGTEQAFVTENGVPGGAAAASDVDFGPTRLTSPPINLAGSDGLVTYHRWFFTSNDDALTVEVSNNGVDWEIVEVVTGSDQNAWWPVSFRVGEFVTPTATVQVRFSTSDPAENSITEAGIDFITVDRFVCSNCVDHVECDDGLFCNGLELCSGGACGAGAPACPGQQCDESGNICLECTIAAHCNDNVFCNGVEACVANSCVNGGDPCPGQSCAEVTDTCVDCLVGADCNDGLFCNGPETCVGGSCFVGAGPCPGQFCDEGADICEGPVPLQPRMGQPLSELNAFQLSRFNQGRTDFDKTFAIPSGLGPVFNQNSCGSCHNTPLGGSGTIEVTRFGHLDGTSGVFDPLESLGGSLLQHEAISGECAEEIPVEANITAQRVTTPALGLGLIEAIEDASIQALADNPPAGVSGRTHIVEIPEAPPGTTGVGRFGWKAQQATVLGFTAGAALNEMGVTNRVFPQDNAPNGDEGLLAVCDSIPDPEDKPNAIGLAFIDRVNEFQRFSAPPPQTPRSGMTGEEVFNTIGCNSCHVSPFTTSSSASVVEVLRNRTIKPYTDFLLHDMGGNADQIAQDDASTREMRTPPLWGVRARDPLWHDGRVEGGTFEERIVAVIAQHDDPFSEGRFAAQAFAALPQVDKDALVGFLDSLGRAEFDFTGDNLVDAADWPQFMDCYTGPGAFFTPDDLCAIADIDQDGDIDDSDYTLFLAAAQGSPAGRVPDGSDLPGTQLLVGLQPNGEIVLTWGASCSSGDDDYGVYVGTIGDFTSHEAALCSTGGAEAATLSAASGSYILVVPRNVDREGSYGVSSAGVQRPRSQNGACVPQELAFCAD